jgi:glutamine amidotransferase
MKPIVIIDYGAGNLRSVQKAFEHLGHQVSISADPMAVAAAPALVFPGQGASPPAMTALNASGMADSIRGAIREGKPFFGVCLGLQLLMDWSEEGGTPCLGVLSGTVKRLPQGLAPALKIPHMGWNSVSFHAEHPVFEGVPQESYFYFVHSYYAAPDNATAVLGTTSYGVDFCSVAAQDNLVATQFHPEKSGPLGLRLYDNFVRRLVHRKADPGR